MPVNLSEDFMKKGQLGFILMLLAAMGFAVAVILMRVMTQSMAMLTHQIGIWRYIIAGPLVWLVGIFRNNKVIMPRTQPFRLILLGFVFALSGFSALFALDRIPSSLYIIILYIYPSLTVLYSLLRNRPVPSLFWLGLPLSIIGLALTVYQPRQNLVIDLFGLLMTAVNALAMVVYMIMSEKIFKGFDDRFTGTKWVMTGTLLVSLVMIPIFGLSLPHTAREWILLLSYSIFGTLMPILSMNAGLQFLGAARGSVIISFQPVITILLSLLFLNEMLTLQQWFGGLIVIASVFLLQLSPDRETKGK
jgi:drug/metabolite transporter (DMT)-like permease